MLQAAKIGLVVPLALALSGCGNPARNPDAIATVGDSVITRAEFDHALAQRVSGGAPDSKQRVLDDLIRREVMFQKAREAGLDRDSDMTNRFKEMVVAAYEERFSPPVNPPREEDLVAYYQQHSARYRIPEKRHLTLIRLSFARKATPEKRAEAEERVRQIRSEAELNSQAAPDFGALAQKYSEDAVTRYRNGDCGWLARSDALQRWPEDAVSAAFALTKPGEISPVISTSDGFFIFKLIAQQEAATRPFAEVRSAVEFQCRRDRAETARRDFYARQEKGIPISINQAALTSVPSSTQASASSAPPPSMPAR